MKKRIIQKIVVFSLVLAMQAAPLSYAAEPADGTLQEGTTDVTGETDTTESNEQEGNDPLEGQEGSETETPGETVPGEPEGSGDIVVPGEPEDSGTGENPAGYRESGYRRRYGRFRGGDSINTYNSGRNRDSWMASAWK